jgi:TatA/E family protein of Tat protein translocase
MFGIGQTELIVLLVIVLLIFGPKNLPKLARSMGQAIRDFRTGIKGVEREIDDEDDDAPVETSAKIEGKGGGASVSSDSGMGEKKAHGPG